jgi:hypothetical protein
MRRSGWREGSDPWAPRGGPPRPRNSRGISRQSRPLPNPGPVPQADPFWSRRPRCRLPRRRHGLGRQGRFGQPGTPYRGDGRVRGRAGVVRRRPCSAYATFRWDRGSILPSCSRCPTRLLGTAWPVGQRPVVCAVAGSWRVLGILEFAARDRPMSFARCGSRRHGFRAWPRRSPRSATPCGACTAGLWWSPRRNRTGDPILTIDAPLVHNASQHLTCPHDRAGQRGLSRVAGWGDVRLCVAQFLANLWHA